jgi:hypothetical protein
MTAPTPRQFQLKIAQTHARIKHQLSELPDIYERAYNASAWQVGRESVGKIARGGISKPLEGIVGDPLDKRRPGRQAAIRRKLEEAEKHLADAESAIATIEREINKAMNRLDPPETFEALRNPISIMKDELEDLLEAQVRRRQRGEVE